MSNTLIAKKSSVAGKIPLAGDLQVGELAINLADQKLYSKNVSGNVVEIGGSSSGLPSQTGNSGKYLTTDGMSASWVSIDLSAYLTTASAAAAYQPLDADLTAIAALAGTGGILKKTAANTWALDATTYLDTTTAASTYASLSGAYADPSWITSLAANKITGAFSDAAFTLADDVDPTKLAVFQLSGITTGTTRTYTLPNVSGTLAALNLAQTFTGSMTVNATFSNTISSATFSVGGTTQTTGTITLGGNRTDSTGAITIGQSQTSQTLNLHTGATASAATKTLNIGTAGLSGSTTTINIGSAVVGATTNVATYGGWTFNGPINPTGGITGYVIGTNVQAWDADLDAIAALTGTSGFLKTSGTGTWTVDTTIYAANDQTMYLGTTAVAINRASAAGLALAGVSVDGSAGTLATARTLTIGSTGKTFNGSANVAWSLTEIGAAPAAGSTSIVTLGTVATGTWNATNIALGKGGTNAALTAVNGGVVYSNASAMAITAAGTAGQALVSAGAAAPAWTTLTLENMPDAAFKRSVRAATTADLAAASSTTTTLTGTLVALPAQDGITLAVNDRLLVKDQTTSAQNGIYVVTNLGVAGTTAWVLTRSTDADTASEIAGAIVNVDSGTTNGGGLFDCDFKTTDTLGTTAITFNKMVDTSYLSTWTGSTAITTLGTIASGTWSGSTIAVNKGGTGATTLTGLVYGNGTSAMTAATAAQIVAAIGSTAVASATNADTLDGNHAAAFLLKAGDTMTGNLTFSGTGLRIMGDFANATAASRPMFQNSNADSATAVRAIPSGTGTAAVFQVGNSSDANNQSVGELRISSTAVQVRAETNGTGSYLPLELWTGGLSRFTVGTSGQLGIGATPTYGTAGQVLTSGGPSAAPTWGTPTATDSTKLPLAGGTLTGLLQISQQGTINTTTPGLTNYGLHFTGQTTADYAAGITWNGGTGTTGAQAGIYVQGSGTYGTKMYLATTDSYATGAKTAISIDHTGLANFVRVRPTALGNVILDAGNYVGYSAFTGAVGGARFYTGYDSGVANSVSCNNWFRTSGAVGLYYASYGRGIQPTDGTVSYGNNMVYGSGLNGWQGWSVTTDNKSILMGNGTNVGIYNPVGGIWLYISDMSGNATFAGNVTAYSDLRLKKNVREIDDVIGRRDTLAKAAIKYERDGRTRVGYGAQTLLENGCAEFVMEADDALKTVTGLGTLSVDYGETAAVLAVVSKLTDERLANLEAHMSAKVMAFEARIAELEQQLKMKE